MNNNYSNSSKEKDKDDDIRFSINLSLLTDRQRAILDSIKRDYLEDALLYLKDHGLSFENTKYYKLKIKSIKNEHERIIQIGDIILEYLQKTNDIEIDLMTMWKRGNNEKDLYKRETIGKRIIAIQHFLSLYHKIIKDILIQNSYFQEKFF